MSDTTASERLTHGLTALADREEGTPCQGRQGHRWTSDDYDDLEWAAFHCVSLGCPLLDLCGEAADELKAKHFTWGGTVRSTTNRKDR